MTDPERAAFVKWFAERLTHDDFMDPGGDLWGDEAHRRAIADLAAQAVEKAVRHER